MDYLQLDDAFRRRRIDHARFGLSKEIGGLLLPGVDGDFLEIAAFDEGLWRNLLEELEKECANVGVDWSLVSEDEFKTTTWSMDR